MYKKKKFVKKLMFYLTSCRTEFRMAGKNYRCQLNFNIYLLRICECQKTCKDNMVTVKNKMF